MSLKRWMTMTLAALALLARAEDANRQEKISGIGAKLKAVAAGVLVDRVFPGSPAAEAGIQAGEVILEVDGVSVVGQPLKPVVQRVVGPAGTTVTLRLAAKDRTTREVTVTRGEITLSAASADDFLGRWAMVGEPGHEVRIARLEDQRVAVVCEPEHWQGQGVVYRSRRDFVLKGYFRMAQGTDVPAGIRGAAGFLTIGYDGPGTLLLLRAWNLKNTGSGDQPSKTVLTRVDRK